MILEKKDDSTFDIATIPEPLRPMAEEAQKFMEIRNIYHSAIREVSTKLEILDDEFEVKNDYNPIHHMECRVKSVRSIFEKLQRKGRDITIDTIMTLTDIAGIRVICNYIDDIYTISKLLTKQDDVELIREKDYIAEPKESGYRSLHLVVIVPVFLSDKTERIPVEIQIRTIAMDTWACLEHELKYKSKGELSPEAQEELKQCARDMAAIDEKMQMIHKNDI
ncbi:MAG: GTP pyrophosphokinase family protein [Eubacteriaceae bacterium]|nr:GTP pyrophosphokinase family protein [Eubacteriaceae bacterium]